MTYPRPDSVHTTPHSTPASPHSAHHGRDSFSIILSRFPDPSEQRPRRSIYLPPVVVDEEPTFADTMSELWMPSPALSRLKAVMQDISLVLEQDSADSPTHSDTTIVKADSVESASSSSVEHRNPNPKSLEWSSTSPPTSPPPLVSIHRNWHPGMALLNLPSPARRAHPRRGTIQNSSFAEFYDVTLMENASLSMPKRMQEVKPRPVKSVNISHLPRQLVPACDTPPQPVSSWKHHYHLDPHNFLLNDRLLASIPYPAIPAPPQARRKDTAQSEMTLCESQGRMHDWHRKVKLTKIVARIWSCLNRDGKDMTDDDMVVTKCAQCGVSRF